MSKPDIFPYLSERERSVIYSRIRENTYQEIGVSHKISRQRAQQIERTALRKIYTEIELVKKGINPTRRRIQKNVKYVHFRLNEKVNKGGK